MLLGLKLPSASSSSSNFCASLFVFVSLFISCVCPPRTEAAATYLRHFCLDEITTPNSTYRSNLNHLLAYLSSNATRTTGFYNATASSETSEDTVYGIFLCRGDLPAEACRDCAAGATKDLVQRCPEEEGAVGYYEECMLRYSSRYIFSSLAPDPNSLTSGNKNISDAIRFSELLRASFNELATGISDLGLGAKKFGTKEARFTSSQTVYTLVQCTPDLTGSDCNRCLQIAMSYLPGCCSGKESASALFPSCTVRYNVHPFYLTVNTSGARPNPLVPPPPGKGRSSSLTIIIVVASISVSTALFLMGYCFLRKRARTKYNAMQAENSKKSGTTDDISTLESLQFNFATIEAATEGFSVNNKLGEGGFGAVYKGTLTNGQQIAVKRLSKRSSQGGDEFKNEVVLVAKLQHRNLARLVGFCLEGEEKILVYEFVPNKSLDYFLYDPERQGQLDWSRRYKIIVGIARGILYLHEDSRLRIIHRDLKASNILLDGDMNPKVSDFGMAKIFGVDQTQGKTRRIAGTFGYMSPEYAMHGKFSVKSDVYSFGVLILEILSGKKISSFSQSDGSGHLLTYAWKHWRDGTPLELLDPSLGDSYSINEVIRCLHFGLLCVQDDPADRPTIASVVLMLNSYSVALSSPKQPAYWLHSRTEQKLPLKEPEADQSTSKSMSCTVNEVSVTELYPR
ncbi:cysteine-rich receptor-like protein kinase 10 [Juglans regia]|uniref:Cysteine-rich receptor-like protein kinase 10 n=2 Tax=Juglans regia TaxID=51240 RepID=A0A6P9E7W2_JUGRE|nr:cysteine-rich receptor-like protein kinase 10 [Juglans regia]